MTTLLLSCLLLYLIGVISASERKECPALELDKFCNAVQGNDFSTVSEFLGQWSDANIMNAGTCGGISPLSLACALGHVHIVDTLLMFNNVVDVNYNEGGSALMMAVTEGQNDIVKILLQVKGIDVNLVEASTGGSALQAAALLGHVDIVKQLLEVEGIEVNSQSSEGYSPLSMAARAGYADVVELLLNEDRVDINLVDNAGDTVLTTVASTGQQAITSLILKSTKGSDVNHKNTAGFTALMLSSLLGYTSIVEDLLQQNADVNMKGKDEWTALLFAIAKGHADIVKLLVTVSDVQGWTASTLATHLQHTDILDMLESIETAY